MFFVTRCHSPEVFDLVEETFNPVTFSVKRFGKAMKMLAIGFIRNIWRGTLGFDLFSGSVGSVGFVAKKYGAFGKVRQKQISPVNIMCLPRGQHQFDRQTTGVSESVNFRTQPSSGTAHTMNSVVFFTLAAC